MDLTANGSGAPVPRISQHHSTDGPRKWHIWTRVFRILLHIEDHSPAPVNVASWDRETKSLSGHNRMVLAISALHHQSIKLDSLGNLISLLFAGTFLAAATFVCFSTFLNSSNTFHFWEFFYFWGPVAQQREIKQETKIRDRWCFTLTFHQRSQRLAPLWLTDSSSLITVLQHQKQSVGDYALLAQWNSFLFVLAGRWQWCTPLQRIFKHCK